MTLNWCPITRIIPHHLKPTEYAKMSHAKRDVMLQYTRIIQHFKPTEYSAYKPMPNAKRDVMLQYTRIIQHHLNRRNIPLINQCHMQNVTSCRNILLIQSSVLWKCKMPLYLDFMLLVYESVGQFRSNITGIFLTELKIKLLSISQSFVCNMISRCENKIGVAWPLLGLRGWDYALRVVACWALSNKRTLPSKLAFRI